MGLAADQIREANTNVGDVVKLVDVGGGVPGLPPIDGSQLLNVGLVMEAFGSLDGVDLPAIEVGPSITMASKTLTTFRARRGTAGASGTTTIQLEVNGSPVVGATLSWTGGVDGNNAIKSVVISQAVVAGDKVSFRLTAAEPSSEDIFAAVA